MRSTVVRRTARVASAAALALFAAACGGSSDDGGKGTDGAAGAQAGEKPSAPPAAARPLTAAELEKAALTQADVKSGKVTEVAAKDDIAQGKVEADKAACAPLADLQVGSCVGTPSAVVKRGWKGTAKKPAAGATDEEKFLAGLDAPQVLVTLASYGSGGAERAMKDLSAAAGACAGGFGFTVGGEKTQNVKVEKTTAPQGGDEALAVTTTAQVDKDLKAPVKGVVVRKGATLACFPALNIGAAAAGKGFPFPTDILDAQLAKLK